MKTLVFSYFVKSACSAFRECQAVEAIFSSAVYEARPIDHRRSKIRFHDLLVSVSTTEQQRIFLASAYGYPGRCTLQFPHNTKSVRESYASFSRYMYLKENPLEPLRISCRTSICENFAILFKYLFPPQAVKPGSLTRGSELINCFIKHVDPAARS
jgi:hypothetical protein